MNSDKCLNAIPRPSKKAAVFIWGAAFAIRIAYLLGYRHNPFYGYFFLDPQWHHEWALEIASGNWLGDEVFFRAPLYPYFLGIIYKLTGASLLAPRLAQFAMGAVSSVFVYLLGIKLFRRQLPAIISGLIFACYGPMIYFEGELEIPVLIVFLDLLGLWLFYVAIEKDQWKYFAFAGLVFGLRAIARPDVSVPVIGLALWVVAKNGSDLLKRRVARRFLPFALSFFLFPMVVTVRNGIIGGDYVFVASQGGANFFIGNNPSADGKTAELPGGVHVARTDKYKDSVWYGSVVLAEKIAGHSLKPSEISALWFDMGLEWIRRNPMRAFKLYCLKLFYLLHGHEMPSNNIPYFAGNYSNVLRVLMWDRVIAFPAGIIIPLCIIGMITAWPERRAWAPLYIFSILYAGTIILFFVTGRFRMPLVGPMILFAVCGVNKAIKMVLERRWKKFALIVSGTVFMMFISNVDAFGVRYEFLGRPYINLGNYYLERGELDEAAKYFNKVLQLHPGHYQAVADLGIIALRKGDYAAAEKLFRQSLKGNDTHPELHNLLGVALESRGDLDGAEAEYIKALELFEGFKLASDNLTRVREKKQKQF